MKKMNFKNLQLFAFDDNNYCDFSSTAAKAVAGKDVLLCIYDNSGENLIAVAGQQGLTTNRSADTVETTSKDTAGDWKSYQPGMKEWSIDVDGIYVKNDQSHKILSRAFENGDPVCVKVVDKKAQEGLWGGLAYVTDYPIEAPYDDSMTYSMTLTGAGALVDLTLNPVVPDTMPEGSAALEPLTIVSVAGSNNTSTQIYVNPTLTSGNKYFYKTGQAPLTYPSYGEAISETSWDGTSAISGVTAGQEIMIIETDSNGSALKAGQAVVTVGGES